MGFIPAFFPRQKTKQSVYVFQFTIQTKSYQLNKPLLHIALFIFLLGVFPSGISAQINLVPNPSFEVYDTCPDAYSVPWEMDIEHALGWYCPTVGTADYYNACDVWVVDVPSNYSGYQYPQQGNGYVGFFVYEHGVNYREYVQAKLISPMVAGTSYSISFYVSLADRSEFASSQIGAFISDYPISSTNYFGNPLNVVPQIENPVGNFITDTTNWTLIQGYYFASGGEEYITIGNFHDSLNNDTVSVPFFLSMGHVAYYFLDGISVSAVTSDFMIPNVFTPNGDDINDVISFNDLGLAELHCEFYNRWGELVGKITSPDMAWDGRTMAGVECPEGIYYCVFNAKGADGKEFKRNGYVHLMR